MLTTHGFPAVMVYIDCFLQCCKSLSLFLAQFSFFFNSVHHKRYIIKKKILGETLFFVIFLSISKAFACRNDNTKLIRMFFTFTLTVFIFANTHNTSNE